MHIIKLDLKQGSISVDTAPIAVDEKGVLAGSIEKFVRHRFKQMTGEHCIAC